MNNIELFEIGGDGIPKLTSHFYHLKTLNKILSKYKDDQDELLAVVKYLFYMSCPSPNNPFFNRPEDVKQDEILEEVGGNFNPEDAEIEGAVRFCKKMYETPLLRIYEGYKTMMNRIANYLKGTEINDDVKGGNGQFIKDTMKNYPDLISNFKKAEAEYLNEIGGSTRGGVQLAIDEDDDD